MPTVKKSLLVLCCRRTAISHLNDRKFRAEVLNNASTRSQQSGSDTAWSSQRS